jgi:GMP synthase-like glutamine amidotransferase
MKVHVFQHAPFEDLGSIAAWLRDRGAEVRYTRFFADERPPNLDQIDLLIAMGGPMSVNDERELPWLTIEKQAVRDAIARNIPVLGVCLGAQLIASALGARVYPNSVKEIGWFPIHGVPAAKAAFAFPPHCPVFHWHGETFDLPAGAIHLARSAACRHQAFQIGRNVLALQFHLEMTAHGLLGLVENCRNELVSGPYVQHEQELLAVSTSHMLAAHELMNQALTYLVEGRRNEAPLLPGSDRSLGFPE